MLIQSKNLWKALGPGILVACAAVGGSHLVWSTRAGAIFGWSLVWLVLLANLIKLPFFLYGQRYTAATGESLLAGYKRESPGFVWIFLGINILTGTINIAAVSMLAGALLSGYGIAMEVGHLAILVMAVCTLLLLLGQYQLLDGLAKVIIAILAVATITAVLFALPNQPERLPGFEASNPYELAGFAFLITLLGWMPAPIDLSAWSSLWMFSRKKQTGHFATPKEAAFDFYIGYLSTTVLAILFLALGALVMHGTGAEFSSSGIGFSKQLVQLYTETIGAWSHFLILTAAFITMFSTSLTCIDGYPRSLAASCSLVTKTPGENFHRLHRVWLMATVFAASLVILFFVKNLIQLLSFAAIVSFLTSPILAYINFRVMRSERVPTDQRPGIILSFLSWTGIAFFTLMSLGYLYVTFLK